MVSQVFTTYFTSNKHQRGKKAFEENEAFAVII